MFKVVKVVGLVKCGDARDEAAELVDDNGTQNNLFRIALPLFCRLVIFRQDDYIFHFIEKTGSKGQRS
jgi:hypothetical protein